jgi:hypothetical protein
LEEDDTDETESINDIVNDIVLDVHAHARAPASSDKPRAQHKSKPLSSHRASSSAGSSSAGTAGTAGRQTAAAVAGGDAQTRGSLYSPQRAAPLHDYDYAVAVSSSIASSSAGSDSGCEDPLAGIH